jgi:putative PIN family toxin of toxin-antitoxin system
LRVVLDSNVLISALISPGAPPHSIYRAWRDKRFLLVTSHAQIAELRRASRYPKLRAIVPARDFGALLNRLHGALVLRALPQLRKLGRTRILAPVEFLRTIERSK